MVEVAESEGQLLLQSFGSAPNGLASAEPHSKGKMPAGNRRGRLVTDANELRQQAAEQEQAFEEKFGYPASEVPGIWVGQYVALNMLGGLGGDRQLAPTRASGMLEAISLDGVVLSVEDRVVFIPRESVLQLELYKPDQHDRWLDVE
jgi:hypothetical protein